MTVANVSNGGFIGALFGLETTSGGKFVNASIYNAGTGNIDLYLCPTGKRAFVSANFEIYNTSGGTITFNPAVKNGGVYYKVAAQGSLTTVNSGLSTFPGIVLEAGESLAIVTSGTGLNILASVYEFDSSIPIKSYKNFNVVNGDNTVYTCPANKSAFIVSATTGFTDISTSTTQLYNPTVTSINQYTNIVNSGGSPTNSNRSSRTVALSGGSLNPVSLPYILYAGDYINVNNSDASNGIIVFGLVVER